MGSSFRNDSSGAALVEFTLVFPVVMVIILGVIDVALLMIDWSSYSRITYTGARYAATNAPVASGINADIAGTIAGASCVDGSTGATTSNCTVRNPSTCTATSTTAGGSGTCTNSYGFTAPSLDGIVGAMRKLIPA
ncbi:TadE/TadG family type IV pilus assembly protein, partial [Nostoc sp. NIES-2111]